jgi:hypothetical protein
MTQRRVIPKLRPMLTKWLALPSDCILFAVSYFSTIEHVEVLTPKQQSVPEPQIHGEYRSDKTKMRYQ